MTPPNPDPFRRAFYFSLSWEVGSSANGGYVNDPADPGGETKFGISKRAHPDLHIKALELEDAARIYRAEYWQPTGARIDVLRQGRHSLAAALFDFAIHSGVRRAVRSLQVEIGTRPDGDIGPATNRALELAADKRYLGLVNVALDLVASRRRYLERLIAKRLALKRFERGWFARLDDLASRILEGHFEA